MDAEEFRRRGREMIDYVPNYLENIGTRQPFPDVQPGYFRQLIPDYAPASPGAWDDLFKDIERVIMPGASSPACTELEVVTVDWLGKMLDLPPDFLSCSGGNGGGVIQGTASESTLLALLSARTNFLHKLRKDKVDMEDRVQICSLHVEPVYLIPAIEMRTLETDDKCALNGEILQQAIYLFHAMSFSFNPHKWLQVNFDCSTMWVKDSTLISDAFSVDPLYLKHEKQGQIMPDYRHRHIPLGRRFLSLKLWFVLRLYGQKGILKYVRKDVRLAHEFKNLVLADERYELFGEVTFGLVCFRLKSMTPNIPKAKKK